MLTIRRTTVRRSDSTWSLCADRTCRRLLRLCHVALLERFSREFLARALDTLRDETGRKARFDRDVARDTADPINEANLPIVMDEGDSVLPYVSRAGQIVFIIYLGGEGL